MPVVSSIAFACPVFMGNINTLILSCPEIVFSVIAWPKAFLSGALLFSKCI